jgi:hypothetical protein
MGGGGIERVRATYDWTRANVCLGRMFIRMNWESEGRRIRGLIILKVIGDGIVTYAETAFHFDSYHLIASTSSRLCVINNKRDNLVILILIIILYLFLIFQSDSFLSH